MRWRPARDPSQAVFEALKTGSTDVRVTEKQRDAIIALRSRAGEVRALQEWHALAREMSPEWTG